jgi:hypothetical protein
VAVEQIGDEFTHARDYLITLEIHAKGWFNVRCGSGGMQWFGVHVLKKRLLLLCSIGLSRKHKVALHHKMNPILSVSREKEGGGWIPLYRSELVKVCSAG